MMTTTRFLGSALGGRRLFAGMILFLALAFFLNQWQNKLEVFKTRAMREYRLGLDLSDHKEERIRSYRDFIGSSKLPSSERLDQKGWIKFAQGLAADENLALRELKPVYEPGRKRGDSPAMFLVLEGSVSSLVRFLYRVAQADDSVYVDQLAVALSDDRSESVQVQIKLSQLPEGL